MSDDELRTDELPIGDEPVSRELWARIIAYDEALTAGQTLDLCDDQTVSRLPAELQQQVFEVLECLNLVARVRKTADAKFNSEEATQFGRRDSDATRRGVSDDQLSCDSLKGNPLAAKANPLNGRQPPVNDSAPSIDAIDSEHDASNFRIGRFTIEGEIGSGGHGIVFAAYDPVLKRDVALKVPRPEFLLSTSMRQRFIGEAQAAAALDHPNIVKVYDAGLAGTVCFIAEELCDGPSLATWLKQHPQGVDPNTATLIVIQLAAGLAHAHQKGILHRDLKPGNVVLTHRQGNKQSAAHETKNPSGAFEQRDFAVGQVAESWAWTPKLADFGICKALDAADAGATTLTRSIIGTAAYMAPEQAESNTRRVGEPADVYSLGVILYELLTGRLPIEGQNDVDTLRRLATDVPHPICQIRKDVPRDLQAICLKCLEKDPIERYATADDLSRDLNAFSPVFQSLHDRWASSDVLPKHTFGSDESFELVCWCRLP